MRGALRLASRGQVHAESLMTLTLTAYSPNGTTTVGGYQVPAFTSQGTTPGKVQAGSQAGSDTATRYVRLGDVEYPVEFGGLHIPVSAFVTADVLQIQASEERGKGWEFVVTAVGAGDPALLNARYLVVGVPAKTFATARRLDVVRL